MTLPQIPAPSVLVRSNKDEIVAAAWQARWACVANAIASRLRERNPSRPIDAESLGAWKINELLRNLDDAGLQLCDLDSAARSLAGIARGVVNCLRQLRSESDDPLGLKVELQPDDVANVLKLEAKLRHARVADSTFQDRDKWEPWLTDQWKRYGKLYKPAERIRHFGLLISACDLRVAAAAIPFVRILA